MRYPILLLGLTALAASGCSRFDHLGQEPSLQRSVPFDRNCGACHHPNGSVSAPLPWTEPHPGRGTGTHRVPSLVGVADRTPLLHDGSVATLEQLLGDGPSWHRYGSLLAADERAALLAYVREHFASPPGR